MKDLTCLEKYRWHEKELALYGVSGDKGNGIFKIPIYGVPFFCVASNGGGWDHVSVSKANRKMPTWEEMCKIKDMFFEDEETVVQYHPRKSEYVNVCDCCLHLWRPIEHMLPAPPKIYV